MARKITNERFTKITANYEKEQVGLFSIPTENEMQAAMEEIRQNPQQFKTSA